MRTTIENNKDVSYNMKIDTQEIVNNYNLEGKMFLAGYSRDRSIFVESLFKQLNFHN